MAPRSRLGARKAVRPTRQLAKAPTGIRGLDDVTQGGLPRGRTTLVCGGAGSGKTLLALEFIVRGIRELNEPGVFVTFEETADDLAKNVTSLGFDLNDLIRKKKLAIDYVYIERREIEETGEYDLEGLFVRLGSLIDEVGAKRVALDSLEALFAGLPNEAILRSELRRLFRWLKERGVTAVITAEQGQKTLTRYGLEEYVSDCVIFLDHRVQNQVATRRLRIVKYRGSSHGTNEYPAMIDKDGLSVLPISSLGLRYPVSTERVSTGVSRLDHMLGGRGYFRGSSILVSGTAGSGKSSIASAFAERSCKRGERCLYLSFEESPDQIMRNMGSIGFDLGRWVKKGLLRFNSTRATVYGLEQHLVGIHNLIGEFEPKAVVIDPVTNLACVGTNDEIKATLTQIIDFLKSHGVTALFTSLTRGAHALEQSEVDISSLMDTWILLQMVQSASERNRILYVLKSRGMAHSNQMRELILSDDGIDLADVYAGPGAVYTGSARVSQEAADRAEALTQEQGAALRERELQQERLAIDAKRKELDVRLAGIDEQLDFGSAKEKARLSVVEQARETMTARRQADGAGRPRS